MNSNEEKTIRTYAAPRLEHYGTLAELTAGGSGILVEGSMTGGGPGTGGFLNGNPAKQRP